MMTLDETMKQLESLGTAQNRKVYARHGAKDPMFGVSYAHLKVLVKNIKIDHALARGLWATGNHDARILATMIADPQALDAKLLDDWANACNNYVLVDALSQLVGKSKLAKDRAQKWSKSKDEFLGQLGWNLIGGMAMYADASTVPDKYFQEKLTVIEREIHKRPNRTRHAMNLAICGIGIGRETLRPTAIAAAKRIGKVEVDHGETCCKTPDAVEYIKRAGQRTKKKR